MGDQTVVDVPLGYPTSVIYMDESGSRASGSNFFVVAAAKVRNHGLFLRGVRDCRDRTGFGGEFKFSEITRGSLVAYYELIDHIENADLHVAACVVDRSVSNPFKYRKEEWRAHADVATQLLVGCINRRELVTVIADAITTPSGRSYEDTVRNNVNKRLGNTSVIGAACLDSRTSDGLQVADLLAGAVAFEYRRLAGVSGKPHSNKAKVVNRLKAALGGVELVDTREGRVNVASFGAANRKLRIAEFPGKRSSRTKKIEQTGAIGL